MTIATGTYTTYATVGIREQLLDKIYRISPEDTPGMSMIGRSKATNVKVEWQTDTLAAAAANAPSAATVSRRWSSWCATASW